MLDCNSKPVHVGHPCRLYYNCFCTSGAVLAHIRMSDMTPHTFEILIPSTPCMQCTQLLLDTLIVCVNNQSLVLLVYLIHDTKYDIVCTVWKGFHFISLIYLFIYAVCTACVLDCNSKPVHVGHPCRLYYNCFCTSGAVFAHIRMSDMTPHTFEILFPSTPCMQCTQLLLDTLIVCVNNQSLVLLVYLIHDTKCGFLGTIWKGVHFISSLYLCYIYTAVCSMA